MKQFLAGIAVASAVWLALLWAEGTGAIDLFEDNRADLEDGTADAGIPEIVAADDEREPRKSKRRRGKGRRGKGRGRGPAGSGYDTGEGISGDEVGAPGSREVSMGSGGEQQLSAAQIDRGIDQVWGGIQRCLLLVPDQAPATGRVVVGMHIAPSGKVTKVSLSGPNVIIKGEAGACIRRKIKSIGYPSFDGPEMVARYPMTFE